MALPETKSTTEPSSRTGLLPTAKILEFKHALEERTGAMGGWAHERADAVRAAAGRRPIATAAVTAGAALIGGMALGLLLSGKMSDLRRTFAGGSLTSRVRGFFNR